MRYILIILFLLEYGTSYSQKEEVTYDPAVPEYMKYLWADEKTHFRERLYASTDPTVAQITAFPSLNFPGLNTSSWS